MATNIENLPPDIKNNYQKAISAFDRKNYDYVINLLTQVLNLKFDFAEARHLLHLSRREKYKATPGSPLKNILCGIKNCVRYMNAILSENKGDLQGSIEKYEKILKDEPANTQILKKMAELFLKNNLIEQALFIFEETYKLNPHDIGTLKNLGAIYKKRGSIEKSKFFYREVLKFKPDDFAAEKYLRDLDALKTIEKDFKDTDIGDFEIKKDL